MRKIAGIFSCLLLIFLGLSEVHGQDPQLSQFYAAPQLISPAFAGVQGTSKINFNHRSQWPNLDANYQYSSVSGDISLGALSSGIGFYASSDKQFANLETTSLGLQYAYHINLNQESSLSLGMEGAYVNRGLNTSNLIFGDQVTNLLGSGAYGSSNDPILNKIVPNKQYLDLSAGALFSTRNTWVGVSVHHLNAPNKSFVNSLKDSPTIPPLPYTSEDFLAPKYSLQIGTKIDFESAYLEENEYSARNNEKSLSPVLHYQLQGNFDPMDVGAYLTLAPLVFGAWYRGIPIQKSGVSSARESMVFLVGYRQDSFSIGYSYDMTTSNLGISTGGAHEISIAYLFDWDMSFKKPFIKWKRTTACPKF